MLNERNLQGYFVKKVKKAGGLAVKTNCDGHRGWFDLTIVMPTGEIHLIELKKEGGRLSIHQKQMLTRLQGMSANADVLIGKGEVDAWLSIWLS